MFRQNDATSDSSGSGGGIDNRGTMTVANTTLQRNSAHQFGGGIYNAGILSLRNSTLAGNFATIGGGGIYNISGAMDYANTIIADSLSGGDCVFDTSSEILTNTNNLVEDGSCLASLSGDPRLGAPNYNGGPTDTMALLPGSPAIDAGDDAICAAAPVSGKDQRGITRPQGAHCDIGAFGKEVFTIYLPLVVR